jgi:hypothetical protein
MAKKKWFYNDMQLDSEEELQFAEWLNEATEHGYVSKWEYHPYEFTLSGKITYRKEQQLKTKVRYTNPTLLQPHIYTPDFSIWFTEKFLEKFNILPLCEADTVYTIDIKGTFGRFNDSRLFSINQKWVYEKHQVYIHKLIPVKFFQQTFVPKAIAFKKNRKQLEIKKDFLACKFVEEV